MVAEVSETAWSQDLETGIDVLDRQHRRYFDLLNSYLAKAVELPTGSGRILDLAEKLNFLLQYAEEHFSTEEDVMKEAGYPGTKLHLEEHRYFLKHVRDLYNRLKTNGYSPALAREVNYYTAEWFIEHIRISDMKLVDFLNQKSTEDKKLPLYLTKIYKSLFGNT